MAKKGCIAWGCGAAVFVLILLIIAVVFIVRNSVPSPLPEAQQRELVQELTMPAGTPLQDGVAIMIVVDVSGSMAYRVPDANGQREKKLEIAKRVAKKALDAVEEFAVKNPDTRVQVGMTQFGSDATVVLPMGRPDPARDAAAIEKLKLAGSTAIGEGIVTGKKELNGAALKKQHMIVITDGVNTSGRAPQDVVKGLKSLPAEQQPSLYVVAFDVKAKEFQPLIQQGVPVSEAMDAIALQAALDYILYEKILVEQE